MKQGASMSDNEENGPKGAAQVPLSELLKQSGASKSLISRINDADIDKDGNLDVHEIVQLVQKEQRAQADRKLFKNFLIALTVGLLILIAALCGTVYGIVKLTKEVGDDNGVLVSTSTGDVVSTGQVVETFNVSQLYREDVPFIAQELEVLIVPEENGFTAHRVASVTVETGNRAIVTSLDGRKIIIDKDGLYYENSVAGNSTGRRRLLAKSDEPMYGSGRGGNKATKCNYEYEQCLEKSKSFCKKEYPSDKLCPTISRDACKISRVSCWPYQIELKLSGPVTELEECHQSNFKKVSTKSFKNFFSCTLEKDIKPEDIAPFGNVVYAELDYYE